jgi:hypothetical protein
MYSNEIRIRNIDAVLGAIMTSVAIGIARFFGSSLVLDPSVNSPFKVGLTLRF